MKRPVNNEKLPIDSIPRFGENSRRPDYEEGGYHHGQNG